MGGWGLRPVGGWGSLVLGNFAERAYSPRGGGGSGWVDGWVGSVVDSDSDRLFAKVKTFFLEKKSDVRLYIVLDLSLAVTVDGLVVYTPVSREVGMG